MQSSADSPPVRRGGELVEVFPVSTTGGQVRLDLNAVTKRKNILIKNNNFIDLRASDGYQ